MFTPGQSDSSNISSSHHEYLSGFSLIIRNWSKITAIGDTCPVVAGHVDTAFPVAVNFHVEVEDIVAVSHVEFVFDVMFFAFIDHLE